jgi:catechol 2,3-dioxygenase-like lactoylglutathione lyase family enzyme
MRLRRALSHVDLRVRDRANAIKFYDRLLGELGMKSSHGETWCEYAYDDPQTADAPDWIAFTEDKNFSPGPTRVAIAATSRDEVDRIAKLLPEIGSRAIEGPELAYGPRYYAVFFEDPDGNPLEICYIGE